MCVLAFDEFAQQTIMRSPPPWDEKLQPWKPRPWTPYDDLCATDWLQREGIAVNVAVAAQAVEAVAREASFHPVREHLELLEHDGTSRLDSWLTTYLGAAPTPYHREVGRVIMIAAVARIYEPGCKVDTVPIFEGPQGARKSTAVKTLFDPWFSDELADLESKDAAMQARGVWGLEVSELDAMSKAEVSRIKAFISRTTDRFRPPYGSRIVESPRSCVFWGTTNKDDYLKDETGGRRFLPIKIGRIRVEALERDRDQLWAEAVIAYRMGSPWWLTSMDVQTDARRQQRDRYVGDAWDEIISKFVETRSSVAVDEVLREAVGKEAGRWDQRDMNRVAQCLKSFGWERYQVRMDSKQVWRYRRPKYAEPEDDRAGNVTTLAFPGPVTNGVQ
jgi:predicted P-loop ATPase